MRRRRDLRAGIDVARLVYFGLYALQHRGQESAGIAVGDGTDDRVPPRDGPADRGLQRRRPRPAAAATRAIGHTRYSTSGSSIVVNAQPFVESTDIGAVRVRAQRQPDQRRRAARRRCRRRSRSTRPRTARSSPRRSRSLRARTIVERIRQRDGGRRGRLLDRHDDADVDHRVSRSVGRPAALHRHLRRRRLHDRVRIVRARDRRRPVPARDRSRRDRHDRRATACERSGSPR